jgi:molecular chaperone GrpE (heat shock protein)
MKRSNTSTWIYLLLVFASGAALGVFSDRFYTTSSVIAKTTAPRNEPGEFRRKVINEMRTRLKLDEKQVSDLNGILDQTRNEMREFRERTKPEMTAIHQTQVERVNNILSPAQRLEYQKMLDEREAKRAADQLKNDPPKSK